MNEDTNPSGKMASQLSFEKETREEEHEEGRLRVDDEHRRSLQNKPVDPNSATVTGTFPPGLPPENVIDPGRSTPGSGPVVNETGQTHKP